MASVAFAAAGSIFAGVMAVRQGYAQQAAYEAQAGAEAEAADMQRIQIEQEARRSEIQALKEESNRREELRRSLSASTAQAVAQGLSVGGFSGSYGAAMRDIENIARKDIDDIRLFAEGQATKYALARQSVLHGAKSSASAYSRAGDAAVQSGWIRGASSMFDFANTVHQSGALKWKSGTED